MRIISCASYYGTGSSAITNLLEEYKDCVSLTDYEFRFLYDPDGISDLEFHLVENHHRHTSGYALKRYKRFVDELGNPHMKKYEYYFQNQWKKLSYEYIDALTEFTHKGYWHQDVTDRGLLFYIWKRSCNKLLQKTIWRKQPERALNELPHEITYCSFPTEEKFLYETQKYIENLFEAANINHTHNLMVDQVVPASNLGRYLRYFKDIKVFVVDRDPRDVYLAEKYIYKGRIVPTESVEIFCKWYRYTRKYFKDIKVFVVDRDPRDVYLAEKYIYKGRIVPTESVEIFCKWYRYTRKHRDTEKYDTEKVMFVRFEDLIYRYDEKVKEIEQWLGFEPEDHIKSKTRLNPDISIKNTRLWEKIPGVSEEMSYIEKELAQYIYPYDKVIK